MEKKRILCYGDSNTWGLIGGSGKRHPDDVRWTGVCQKILGEEFTIIENGIVGRTTCFENGWGDCKDGRLGLGYAILSSYPLDGVVIMLGSNDLTEKDAAHAATGCDELIRIIQNANTYFRVDSPVFYHEPKILLIAPPTLGKDVDESPFAFFHGLYEESLKLAPLYENVAKKRGIDFLDASLITNDRSPIDKLHLEAEGHRKLGEAIATKLAEMFK